MGALNSHGKDQMCDFLPTDQPVQTLTMNLKQKEDGGNLIKYTHTRKKVEDWNSGGLEALLQSRDATVLYDDKNREALCCHVTTATYTLCAPCTHQVANRNSPHAYTESTKNFPQAINLPLHQCMCINGAF